MTRLMASGGCQVSVIIAAADRLTRQEITADRARYLIYSGIPLSNKKRKATVK